MTFGPLVREEKMRSLKSFKSRVGTQRSIWQLQATKGETAEHTFSWDERKTQVTVPLAYLTSLSLGPKLPAVLKKCLPPQGTLLTQHAEQQQKPQPRKVWLAAGGTVTECCGEHFCHRTFLCSNHSTQLCKHWLYCRTAKKQKRHFAFWESLLSCEEAITLPRRNLWKGNGGNVVSAPQDFPGKGHPSTSVEPNRSYKQKKVGAYDESRVFTASKQAAQQAVWILIVPILTGLNCGLLACGTSTISHSKGAQTWVNAQLSWVISSSLGKLHFRNFQHSMSLSRTGGWDRCTPSQ